MEKIKHLNILFIESADTIGGQVNIDVMYNMIDICIDHRYGESSVKGRDSDPQERWSLYKLDDEPPMDFNKLKKLN